MQWASSVLGSMMGPGSRRPQQQREAVPAAATERQRRSQGVAELRRSGLAHGASVVVSAGSVLDFGGATDWPPAAVAIVNAANRGGLGGGGVDGAITSAGGPQLAADRRALPVLEGTRMDRIATGGAERTGPGCYGSLHAGHVIHAVGPNYLVLAGLGQSMEDGDAQLSEAYRATMRAAAAANIEYLGFSLLSAGSFRGSCSLEYVLRLGVAAVAECAYPGLKEVHLVAFQQAEQQALLQLLEIRNAAAVSSPQPTVPMAVDQSVEVAPAPLTPRQPEPEPEPAPTPPAPAAGTPMAKANELKEQGNAEFKEKSYDSAIGKYKAALRVLELDAGPKSFGAGASVLVRPAAAVGGGPPAAEMGAFKGRGRRNGGLRYAMVLCDDAGAKTVDVEYIPAALADGGGDEGEGEEEEEDDVAVSRCTPLHAHADGIAALQLSCHMNWARCLKELKRPHDGSKRANIAVALAEAARARAVAVNNDRIAGLAPVALEKTPLVKAVYLRAQCYVTHKEWKRAESDLSLALQLDPENATVAKLLRQLPKMKERQVRDNKRLSKEMSQWLAKESDAVEAGLGDVANSDAMDMAIADAAGDTSRHVRTVGPLPGIQED